MQSGRRGPFDVEQRLGESASGIDRLRDSVSAALRRVRGRDSGTAGWYFVPGRIEVLGKHTDYAGGRSLLAAVNRGFVIAAAHRSDHVVRVIDATTGESVEFDAAASRDARTPAWAAYPFTVLRRSTRNFPAARAGADLIFASDLPQAAGLSSSSALVVATFLGLDAVRGLSRTPEYQEAIGNAADLAGYLGAVENGMSFRTLAGDAGVGTMGGSEDHTAILCARPGRLVQYSYAPVRFEADAPLPPGWTFAVGASGVRAEKAGAVLTHYNRLSSSTHRLTHLWRAATGRRETTLAEIIRADPDAPLRLREIVREQAADEVDELLTRLSQFIAENESVVPDARASLERGDIAGFAALAARSQYLAEQALRNQIAETIDLVERAHALGAAAASAFGAGFGGSVWALIREQDAHEFVARWRSGYLDRFVQRRADASFFVTSAGPPARQIQATE